MYKCYKCYKRELYYALRTYSAVYLTLQEDQGSIPEELND